MWQSLISKMRTLAAWEVTPLDEATAKYKGEKMVAVYLKQEFGGFAVHLLQK